MNQRSMDLEKSVRMLDDALNSSGKSILRKSIIPGTPQTQRRTLFNVEADDSLGSDISFLPSPSARTSRHSMYRRGANLSMTMQHWELGNLDCSTAATITTIKGREPWNSVSDRLYIGFMEVLQDTSHTEELYDIVSDLVQTCSDTIDLMRNMQKKVKKKADQEQDMWWLENERNTWRLVHCLYQNRLNRPIRQDEMIVDDIPPWWLSEKQAAARFFKANEEILECQIVVDWLEQNALEQQKTDEFSNPQYFTDKTIAWENTLHQIQNNTDTIPFRSSRQIVTELDPDAPLRQNRPLHDLDMEDEDRLMKQVFAQVRCGHLEEAQELCVHCGQPWRAATLEGWRLHHDPNYGSTVNEKLPIEGNPRRDIWKMCAWKMASDKRTHTYARATYGALCGNIAALLPVCHTWHDQLWARMRILVDVRVEQEIRQSVPKSYVAMPEGYWQNNLSLEDIFSELSSSKDPVVRAEASEPAHRVQQLLIMNEVPRLMVEMERWLEEREEKDNPQFVRFLAHIVIILRYLGQIQQEDIGNQVIEAYVKVLMAQGDPRLVARYVKILPWSDQVRWYANYLVGVTDPEEKMACLQVAEECGLDIEAITKEVVEVIRSRGSASALPDLQAETTQEDLDKISALEWVTFYETQRAEALWQTNALIRHFLASRKVEAARKAFNKIPLDSISLVMKQNHASSGSDYVTSDTQQLPVLVAASIREYLCYKSYLDAQEGFSDWFEHFHNAKPIPPVQPTGSDVTFTERVAYDHRMNKHKSDWIRWQQSMIHQTKVVKNLLYNVLLFPDGGWLVDGPPDFPREASVSESDVARTQQMDNLRRLCIPQVVLLLLKVMHSMEEYAECIQLANLIISEQHQLYKIYTKGDLAEVLMKISESSLPLLDSGKDSWGHPTTS